MSVKRKQSKSKHIFNKIHTQDSIAEINLKEKNSSIKVLTAARVSDISSIQYVDKLNDEGNHEGVGKSEVDKSAVNKVIVQFNSMPDLPTINIEDANYMCMPNILKDLSDLNINLSIPPIEESLVLRNDLYEPNLDITNSIVCEVTEKTSTEHIYIITSQTQHTY